MKDKKKSYDALSIVSRLAQKERSLPGTTFIAPYVKGGKTRLRIDGIIYELEVEDCPECWAIMKVNDKGKAEFLEKASPALAQNYLRLLPRLRLVFIDEFAGKSWALPALTDRKQKLQADGPLAFYLSQSCASFETIYCRFDGALVWYECRDRRRDPGIARYLRKALSENTHPEKLQHAGITPQEKLVYKMLFIGKNGADSTLDLRGRIAGALEHAGARLDRFWQNNDGQTSSVRFELDGLEHVVQIESESLTVVSAGICLDGRDGDFDLSSLVGVLREGRRGYEFD